MSFLGQPLYKAYISKSASFSNICDDNFDSICLFFIYKLFVWKTYLYSLILMYFVVSNLPAKRKK